MKNKNNNRSQRNSMVVLLSGVLAVGIIIAVVIAFNKLRSLWLEQCVVTDVNAQVTITTSGRVNTENIRELFELRNGANLATIDFAAKREKALSDSPVIKEIQITRRLPDKLAIAVTERAPFAKMNLKGSHKESGLVCDDEGVVFSARRGTETLPVIREESPGSAAGDHIDGRSRAALTVLRAIREPEFANLNITEIDTSRPDFLLLTLASYKTVKLAWTGMDEISAASREAMLKQLRCISQTIATNLQPDTRVWNATQPGVVTADIYGNN